MAKRYISLLSVAYYHSFIEVFNLRDVEGCTESDVFFIKHSVARARMRIREREREETKEKFKNQHIQVVEENTLQFCILI